MLDGPRGRTHNNANLTFDLPAELRDSTMCGPSPAPVFRQAWVVPGTRTMTFARSWRTASVLALCVAASAAPAFAQNPPAQEQWQQYVKTVKSISKPGPFTADLGAIARIDVPSGYLFIAQKDVRVFNDLNQNETSPNELGIILPATLRPEDWFITFQYNETGYVKEDEKDKIGDAAALLKERQTGQEQANTARRARGWPELEVPGWSQPPFYDTEMKNLAWGLRVREKIGGAESINYESLLLGRKGYVGAVLVCSPDQVAGTVPTYKKLVKGFAYKDGERYSDFREGDRVAEYGLYALAAGGTLAVLAKTGILGKLL